MAYHIDRRITAKPVRADIAALALIAIGLGFLMEGILVAYRFMASDTLPPFVVFLGNLLQQISWSVLICSALTLATLLAEWRSAPNAPFSLLLAPIAVIATKAFQKGISTILALPVDSTDRHIMAMLVGRTVEYTLLNLLLFSLKRRGQIQFWKFFATGISVSTVLGIPIGLEMAAGSASDADQIGTILNEFGWPTLCACFAYGAAKLGTLSVAPRP